MRMLHDPTHLYEGALTPRADKASRIISSLTYAPVLTAFMFILIDLKAADTAVMLLTTASALVFATILPIIIVRYHSIKAGNTDGDVIRKEDRMKPLLGGILSYLLGVASMWLIGSPPLSFAMMVSYTVSTVIVLLISTKWKISIHATGVTGPTMALSIAYWPWGLLMLLLIPLVAWARYVRRKHTPAQLIGGFVYGFLITGFFLWLLA